MGKKKKTESEPRIIPLHFNGPVSLRTLHALLHKLLSEGTDEDLPIRLECADSETSISADLDSADLVTERPAPCSTCKRPHETVSFIRLYAEQ